MLPIRQTSSSLLLDNRPTLKLAFLDWNEPYIPLRNNPAKEKRHQNESHFEDYRRDGLPNSDVCAFENASENQFKCERRSDHRLMFRIDQICIVQNDLDLFWNVIVLLCKHVAQSNVSCEISKSQKAEGNGKPLRRIGLQKETS